MSIRIKGLLIEKGEMGCVCVGGIFPPFYPHKYCNQIYPPPNWDLYIPVCGPCWQFTGLYLELAAAIFNKPRELSVRVGNNVA